MTGGEGAARAALVAIAAEGAGDWSLVERFGDGRQSGAWRVVAPDGASAVLKTSTPEWGTQVLRAREAVAVARAAGWPTPAWLASGRTALGGYQLQELVPGDSIDRLDVAHARAVLAVVETQAGLDPDPTRNWVDFVADELTTGWPALGAAAAGSGPAGRRLLRRCERFAAGADPSRWPRTDLVHGDLRPANVLFAAGTEDVPDLAGKEPRVAGFVDVEALGSGTRCHDLATLLSHDPIDPDAVELVVDAAVRAAGPDVLLACTAQVFLDLVRFVRDHNGDVEATAAALDRRATTVEGLVARSDGRSVRA